MPLFAAIPLAVYFLIFLFLIKKSRFGVRLSLVWAAILWTVIAVLLTESLSVFEVLMKGYVVGGWLLVGLAALIGISTIKNSQFSRQNNFSGLCKSEWMMVGLAVFIYLLVGVNAFFATPNNWDSMTYHLPRVWHWIQNHSVEHYATPILRQLYQPPGAEFLILQFQILTDGDRFANMIQWFALIMSGITLSLIAAELGAGKKGQLLTMVLAATIPMGILQGSSTQNDYVAGFWLSVGVLLGLKLVRSENQRREYWVNLIGVGLSLGLALLTKATIYIFAVPWLTGFVLFSVLKKRKTIVQEILIVAMLCAALNAGFYSRNIKLFGKPLSSGAEDYVNTGNIVANGALNIIRNLSLHCGTPFVAVNTFFKEEIIAWQALVGQTENNSWSDFEISPPSTSEDIAGNPAHLILIVFAVIVLLAFRNTPWLWRHYMLMMIAGFVLFCVLLKWQLFHSRLHLPLFLLSLPVVAVVLERMRPKFVVPIVVGILVAAAIPALFYNERHPLIGKKNVFNMNRLEQYFSYRKFMALPYVLATQFAVSRSGSDVGLVLGADDWEYPLWMLLKKQKPNVRIYHLGVSNISASLADDHQHSATVLISQLADPPTVLNVDKKVFLKRQQFSFMSVYENP